MTSMPNSTSKRAWGEDVIDELLKFMHQYAGMVTRASRIRERARARVSPHPWPAAYVASSNLMTGLLMRLSRRIGVCYRGSAQDRHGG